MNREKSVDFKLGNQAVDESTKIDNSKDASQAVAPAESIAEAEAEQPAPRAHEDFSDADLEVEGVGRFYDPISIENYNFKKNNS